MWKMVYSISWIGLVCVLIIRFVLDIDCENLVCILWCICLMFSSMVVERVMVSSISFSVKWWF